MRINKAAVASTLVFLAACAVAPVAPPPQAPALISRVELFGPADRVGPALSPDGKRLGFLAPVNGVLNVWAGPSDDLTAAKPVTKSTLRPVYQYFFAYDNKHLLYLQDKGGDENWRAYAVNLETGEERDLTPIEGIQAQIQQTSHKHPDELLVAINGRGDRSLHDLYRVKLSTGKLKLIEKNTGFTGYITDDDFRVRFAAKSRPDGGIDYLQRGKKDRWQPFLEIGQEDALSTRLSGFNGAGDTLYLLDSRKRNTVALTTVDLKTGKQTLVFEDARADVSGLITHPTTHALRAAMVNYEREEWRILDPGIQADLDFLKTVEPAELNPLGTSLDDTRWLVAFQSSDKPLHYYLYYRGTKQAKFLFSHRPWLEGKALAPMHPRVIRSRDGLNLVSYLSLPVESDPDGDGVPAQALPLVLNVHGGPWGRDAWGYNPEALWLADRGYAVLSVNFRASTGFGKEFINAGNLEWAGKMHLDLLDAVDWAVKQKIVDPQKIAIMGGSYGGYATLVGLTFTPDTFACGVDIVGPSNLVTLLNTIPPYWKPQIELFTTRVGDHRTEEGRKLLESRSPLNFVDRINKPLLIGQGANDPRVKQTESDQIVKAMQAKGIPVTYVLYPDEGHGFLRSPNRRSFYAVAESFLGQCLGGRVEPVGQDFVGSTILVPQGAQSVPGISEAIKSAEKPPA